MAARWHERIRQLRLPVRGTRQDEDAQLDIDRHLDYLGWLREGSQYHVASPTDAGFTITAANDSAGCQDRFHEIVEHAIANAASAHYEILPHAMSGGKWDRAVIITRGIKRGPSPRIEK